MIRRLRFELFPILIVVFNGSLGLSLVLPFLAILVVRFGGNAFMYGIIGAIYPFFQLISSPIAGKLSDIKGRKPLLIGSQIGTIIGWGVFLEALFVPVSSLYTKTIIVTLPLVLIMLARALDGITGSSVAVAQAYIADITSTKNRSREYGKMSVASNIGFIIGPALAGVLGGTLLGEKLPVLLAIGVSILALFFIIFYLPESHTRVSRHKKNKISIRKVLRNTDIVFMLSLYFLIYLGFSFFYTAFPIYAVGPLGWSVGKMGIYFSILSAMMVVVQGPILSYATKHFKDTTLVIFGAFILGTNFMLLISRNEVLIYMAAVCFAIGNGLMWPTILSIVSKLAGKTMQGTVQGLSASMGSLASIIGLIAGGVLYELIGSMTFIVAAITIYIVMLLSIRLITLEKRFSNT